MMSEIEEDRSAQFPGVTDLIFCTTKAYWKRTLAKQEESRTTKLYFTTGLALEKALISNLKGNELNGECEGIFYHSDGFDYSTDTVVEMKSTRMGTARATGKKVLNPNTNRMVNEYQDIQFEDYPHHWLKQIAAYCYAAKTTKAKLVVLHVIKPEILAWDIEFSQTELETNWMDLQSRRTELMSKLEAGVPPKPFEWMMDWECKDCAFKMMCEANA